VNQASQSLAVPPSGEPPDAGGASDGASVDSLSFLDLIYAVPVGDLAMRVSEAEPGRVSAADWSALALILWVIVLSWLGVHKDRCEMAEGEQKRDPIGDFPFAGWRFVQFILEIVIAGLYFAMGLTLKLTMYAALPQERVLIEFLLFIFGAYFLWDLLDVWLARKEPDWQARAGAGGAVTGTFLAIFTAIFFVVPRVPARNASWVIGCNVVLALVLYGYRVLQDKARDCPGRRPWGSLAGGVIRFVTLFRRRVPVAVGEPPGDHGRRV
jgi:hypothetical protein